MLTNKQQVIQAVERRGEMGVAELAGELGIDKGTVRKVALEAAREGRIGARNNGQGYVFFRTAHGALSYSPPAETVIDAEFVETSQPHSPSHAVILYTGGGATQPAVQPADPRLQAQLRRNAEAKGLGFQLPTMINHAGPSVGGVFPIAWNQAFSADVTGDEGILSLANAVHEHNSLMKADQDRADRNHVADAAQHREDAAKREAQIRQEQMMRGLQAILNWGSRPEPAEKPVQPAGPAQPVGPPMDDRVRAEQTDAAGDPDGDVPWTPEGTLDPNDFTYEELADIDRRANRRALAESVEPADDGRDDDVDDHDGGDGRIITADPNKVFRRRPTFSECVAAARHEEAVAVVHEKIADAVTREWFAKAARKKTTVKEETEVKPEAPSPPSAQSWGERFHAWCTAPTKPPRWG